MISTIRSVARSIIIQISHHRGPSLIFPVHKSSMDWDRQDFPLHAVPRSNTLVAPVSSTAFGSCDVVVSFETFRIGNIEGVPRMIPLSWARLGRRIDMCLWIFFVSLGRLWRLDLVSLRLPSLAGCCNCGCVLGANVLGSVVDVRRLAVRSFLLT